MEKTSLKQVPRWAGRAYSLMAIVLIPWIVHLADTLPSRHIDRHWDTVWVGFDSFILLLIALTLYFIMRRSVWLIVSASALGAFFIVDAWFDVLTSHPGQQRVEALIFAVIELSLSLLTYWLVYRLVRYSLLSVNPQAFTIRRKTARERGVHPPDL